MQQGGGDWRSETAGTKGEKDNRYMTNNWPSPRPKAGVRENDGALKMGLF